MVFIVSCKCGTKYNQEEIKECPICKYGKPRYGPIFEKREPVKKESIKIEPDIFGLSLEEYKKSIPREVFFSGVALIVIGAKDTVYPNDSIRGRSTSKISCRQRTSGDASFKKSKMSGRCFCPSIFTEMSFIFFCYRMPSEGGLVVGEVDMKDLQLGSYF